MCRTNTRSIRENSRVKMTRAQIKESLKAVPMETILLGVHSAKTSGLTAKQIKFAEEIARGESKAGAYRKAYNTKANPGHQSRKGQALAKQDAIRNQVEAFQAAFEAQKYATPAHLRALTIHELTKHALDESFPPAQRVKALELLGKITEVALFTERREVVQVSNPAEIKEKLLASLQLAMSTGGAIDVEATESADSLMAEISQARSDDSQGDDADAHAQAGDAADIQADGTQDDDAAEPGGATNPAGDDPTQGPPPGIDSTQGDNYA
jgi:hypothetical protein